MKTLLRQIAFVALFSLARPAGAAKPEQCGNGRVQAGEWCDTGGDSATCDADCSPVDCGDGHVNGAAGEQCDTAGESATCDADCTLPVCGDSHVNPAAGEDCDGNATAAGSCVSCALVCSAPAPSCTDGVKNGAETDVDCGGGSCGPCAEGQACLANADCLSASCAAGVCAGEQGTPSLVLLSPSAMNFGNVVVGATASLAVTVRNAGTASLRVSSVVVGSAEFSTQPSELTVLPGQTQTVLVRFTPAAAGVRTGTLVLSSNDPANPSTVITLAGTGI